MAKILVRRGLQANLAAASLLSGELAFTTDTGLVYVSDGSNKLMVGRVLQGALSSRPAFGVSGRLYYASDTGDTYLDTGSAWQTVGVNDLADLGGDLDDVTDGSTYAKVKSSELTTGFVSKLNDGTNSSTALEVRGHLDDSTIHRSINDSTTSTTALWSSNKINNEIQNALTGLDWKQKVLDVLATPPGSPTSGDRYLVAASGTSGDFVGHENAIATYTTAWAYEAPSANWALFVANGDYGLVYDADTTSWIQFTGGGQINAGTGLTITGNTLAVNLGAGIKELPTDEVGLDLATNGGLTVGGGASSDQLAIVRDTTTGATVVPVNLSANGTGVLLDNSTVTNDANTLKVKDAGITGTQLSATVAGDGIQGGAGSALAVDVSDFAGNGLEDDGSENLRVKVDTATGTNVSQALSVTSNGVGVKIDNSSVKENGSYQLYVDTVDGGSF